MVVISDILAIMLSEESMIKRDLGTVRGKEGRISPTCHTHELAGTPDDGVMVCLRHVFYPYRGSNGAHWQYVT